MYNISDCSGVNRIRLSGVCRRAARYGRRFQCGAVRLRQLDPHREWCTTALCVAGTIGTRTIMRPQVMYVMERGVPAVFTDYNEHSGSCCAKLGGAAAAATLVSTTRLVCTVLYCTDR
jgi:hypothetical protein